MEASSSSTTLTLHDPEPLIAISHLSISNPVASTSPDPLIAISARSAPPASMMSPDPDIASSRSSTLRLAKFIFPLPLTARSKSSDLISPSAITFPDPATARPSISGTVTHTFTVDLNLVLDGLHLILSAPSFTSVISFSRSASSPSTTTFWGLPCVR